METYTFFDKDRNLIDLHIQTSQRFDKDLNIWHVDSNTLFLGHNLKNEWDSIQGQRHKQRLFLGKLKQVSNTLL